MNYGGIGFLVYCLLATFGTLLVLRKFEAKHEKGPSAATEKAL